LYYTASGIITPVGGRPVHRLREDSLNLCMGRPPDSSLTFRRKRRIKKMRDLRFPQRDVEYSGRKGRYDVYLVY